MGRRVRSSAEMLKLQDAVAFPNSWRNVAVVTLIATGLSFAVLLTVGGLVAPMVAFVACLLVGTGLLIRRTNRLMKVATRIFRQNSDYTPQQAANAARKELGIDEVRYP